MPGFYFAWAGGVITDQTTLVTNGTTHGASFTSVALVGDTEGSQVRNLASTTGLETGSLYELSGYGISAGTQFLFDDSILSGLPNSLNLTIAPSTVSSATFQAKQSVLVGTGLGTTVQGSSAVVFDGLDLPAGLYACYGTPIGETDAPQHTTDGEGFAGVEVLLISTCFLQYDGVSSGTLSILAASSDTTTGTDDQDQPTSIVTWTVASQEVRATTSGQFALGLLGFPIQDARTITGIPGTALGSLEPGLVYNISGNGLALGTTFIAPVSGTEITLDLDATASDQNAILTITGPRTPNAPFDPVLHARFDEDVISFEIDQTEGELATLTVEIKNRGTGFLALGRSLWCWLAWDQAGPAGPPDPVPLFNGRLIGVPKLAVGEIVQLQFLARPDDLLVQKSDLAGSLMIAPYYDPVWLATTATADTVLETYSSLYHVDRCTGTVTISDIIEGDTIIDIGESQALYESFSLEYGEPPLVAVTVEGTVGWQQQASGHLDITQPIMDAFYEAGSGYKRSFKRGQWNTGGGGIIQALCASGLRQDWPRAGTAIGGGWSFSSQSDANGVPLCYVIDASKTNRGGWLDEAVFRVSYSAAMPADEDEEDVSLLPTYGQYEVSFPLEALKIRTTMEFRADRRRTETVIAVVTAGVQRELSDSAEGDRETISLTSEFVGQGVDPDGALPIGSLAYRSYFQTDRGATSFEYLLLAARAKIRARARSVNVTFGVGWRDALPITLRHSVRYTDRRLPGGVCVGKVKSYKLSVGGGTMRGEFTIGCTIGTGEAVAPQEGVPCYVNGYVRGYQVYRGQQTELLEGEISYQSLADFVVQDDGLDFSLMSVSTAVNEVRVTNGILTQMKELDKFQDTVAPTDGEPIEKMKTMKTQVTLDMKPVTGAEYSTAFFPAVTPLTLPMTIDLSAPAAS